MPGQRQEFQQQLETIETHVISLFALMSEDLPKATQALLTGSTDGLSDLADREKQIDSLYPAIENLANHVILLQSPVADDLRFLLSVLRIVPEIERSHDLLMHVASEGSHLLGEDLTPRARGLVERMGALVADMWGRAADSWYNRDASALAPLSERDEQMDSLHASLIAELAAGTMTLPVIMEMALVARDYERLGAHAVNVARRVIYLAGPSGGSTSQPPGNGSSPR